ncbi:MAG: GNAT family N-acetyltransferase [Butyrivibrio sp.]|nr:GNAT family N-acetyltransferase [Butyrivibrio sp.]
MIIGSSDGLWDEYFERLPKEKQDIYFTRKYCRLGERLLGGEAELFVYEEDGGFVMYPYIKRKAPYGSDGERYYDIETPYGYGGPIADTDSRALADSFERAFLAHCASENIIAEFVRFHPLLKNEALFRDGIEVLHNRVTVCLDLSKSREEIWMNDISVKNRNIIRKCEKSGLTVEPSGDYGEFAQIYNRTMERVDAEEFYFFPESYYEAIMDDSAYKLLRVRLDGETLACAIFMHCGNYFHYHLSGSRSEFLKLSPNNILLWEAIKYAQSLGCTVMHFGGGLTDSKEDSLFRFKSRFSSGCADFYIGKRVHNREIYQTLIDKWEREHNKKAKILLQYHVRE